MYVVMTTAELFQYTGCWAGISGTEDSGVEDNLGWDYRSLEPEYTGISKSELDAFEICLPERVARRMGILAPRGEYWIKRAVENGEWPSSQVPQAIPPTRPLPCKGEPAQLQLVPRCVDLKDKLCSGMKSEESNQFESRINQIDVNDILAE